MNEGAAICNDVNTWLKSAWNEDQPRFNATLNSDETTAGSSQLGTDLTNFGNELTEINSDALMSGPPGDPLAIQAVAYDCNNYGVTTQTPGGTITPNSMGS